MRTWIALALVLAPLSSAHAHEGIVWNGTTGGTLAGSAVAVSGFGPAEGLNTYDLSTPDFVKAPLSKSQVCIDYRCSSMWTATFSPALDDLLWYGKLVRGGGANTTGLPVEYTFDRPFVILSGFDQGSVSGTTLTLPATGFHHGVLRFAGTVGSLSCTTTATTTGYQAGTFGHYCPEGKTYCTAKTGLVCGVPAIGSAGIPSAGAPSGFTIYASPARGARSGMVIYGCNGRATIPFQGGLLCVNPAPLRRSSVFSSGGTPGACDGNFSADWNAFASGNSGGNPDPCIQIPGQRVNSQIWGRDSVATGSFLSNALEFYM